MQYMCVVHMCYYYNDDHYELCKNEKIAQNNLKTAQWGHEITQIDKRKTLRRKQLVVGIIVAVLVQK